MFKVLRETEEKQFPPTKQRAQLLSDVSSAAFGDG